MDPKEDKKMELKRVPDYYESEDFLCNNLHYTFYSFDSVVSAEFPMRCDLIDIEDGQLRTLHRFDTDAIPSSRSDDMYD